jgi:DNA modification methylase
VPCGLYIIRDGRGSNPPGGATRNNRHPRAHEETMTKYHCEYTELVDPKTLKSHPKNANKHPKSQVKALAEVIARIGWRRCIVVSNRSGYIVAGHCGTLSGIELECQVPIDYQDFASETEEIDFLMADNIIPELAEWDASLKLSNLEELKLEDISFEIEPMKPSGGGNPDAESRVDEADELRKKWGVELGQLWELGDHRILCGDSTNAEDVARVLSGDIPLLMVTDPPYGVEYDAKWRDDAAKHSPSMGNRKESAVGVVENDSSSDWSEAWKLFPGNVVYIWHAAWYAAAVSQSLIGTGFDIRNQIIWAKNQLAISRGHYHWKHEPCWYGVRKGKTSQWCGDRKQTTLWEIEKPHKSETGHSTQKPIECMARPIRNHESEFVYEPFSGSGTTIIACEQLGRKCRAIEISPAYVAVALQRYMDATGKTPHRI